MAGNKTTRVFCSHCKTETVHQHLHDAAHGIPETHMSGSERYECEVCGRSLFKGDPETRDLQFILD